MKSNAFLGWACLGISLLVLVAALVYTIDNASAELPAAPQFTNPAELSTSAQPHLRGSISTKTIGIMAGLGFGVPIVLVGLYAALPRIPSRWLNFGSARSKAYWNAPENFQRGLSVLRQSLLYAACISALCSANTFYWLVQGTAWHTETKSPFFWATGINVMLLVWLVWHCNRMLRTARK